MIFPSVESDILSGRINFFSDRFTAMLVGDRYKPSTSHRRRSDVIPEVDAQRGYAQGGKDVDVVLHRKPDGTLCIVLGPAVWPQATIKGVRYGVYYHARGRADEDELLAAVDFGEALFCTNGPFALSESTLMLSWFSPAEGGQAR